MRTKWIYTMFVLALSLFTSCNNEVDEAAGNKKTRTVVFRLSVDDAVGSRAAWGEDYTQGDADVPFDTRINLGGLQVVVYDANNHFIGKAENVLYWPVSDGENDNTKEEYQFVGDLSNLSLKEGSTYKFMVFANCDNVGQTTNVGQLPYDYYDITPQTGTGYIPMWGVKTITLTGDELQDLKTIHLLRAAAKIEVALGTAMVDYLLESVTISHHNTRGYIAPKYWNTVENTESLDRDDCANFHSTPSADPLLFTMTEGNQSAKVYVPEYQNTSLGNAPATITVRLKKGVSTTGTSDDGIVEFKDAIQFCSYTNGAPTNTFFDIVRNHHYKFTITGVSGGLEIQYAVMDWVDAGKVELKYEYPTYHNPLLPVIPTSGDKYDFDETNDVPKMYYSANTSENGAFKAYFRITAPTGQRWTPTFKQSQENYKIQVWDQDGTQLLYDTKELNTTDLTAGNNWFQIRVLPLSNDGANTKVVNLGITCKMGDTSEGDDALESTPFYLLINGTANGDIRWPESGDDPRFITIKHVAEPQSTNP